MAEIYRKRWGIENCYQEKLEKEGNSHSPEMGVRYFLFFLSVLIYILWMLINTNRIGPRMVWITLTELVISMSRGRRLFMNYHG